MAINEGCDYLDFNHLTLEFGDIVFHPGDTSMNERQYVFWDAVHYVVCLSLRQ